ncbi:MAG: pseudouridine synthase [Acidobacteria bacterium]|nr:MAG: pseudouridine synthase [Acidobacteriota bacterium]
MQERLQKIIARAGIASRRHAEQLILSGQVRLNGRVVTELGTKADTEKDRVEVSGKVVEAEEKRVYLIVHKPPEVMSTLADPEGRKTLKNLLRGFPSRVYPVGNLEYAGSGLVFMTNDGDLAAALLKKWESVEQIYYVKVKGMLALADLERIGKEAGVRMQTLRQPGASRGMQGKRASASGNFWYEVKMRDSKMEALRNVLYREKHPIEKVKRVALGPLTIEGVPQGRYRFVEKREAEQLLDAGKRVPSGKRK